MDGPNLDILEKYEILTPIIHDSDVYLVMDRETEEIFIEKITNVNDLNLYQQLMDNGFIGVPRVHEIASIDGKTVLIEDYIHGRNLMQLFKKEGVFSEEKLVSYMVRLCDVLMQFHNLSSPIIHRDIKPENIIISFESGIFLIDFNISRQYKPESELDTCAMVSYHFSAPELYGFGQSDQRSDIYSIGATMHFLLTGGYLKETTYNGPLADIIDRCTMLDPSNRYQSIEELKTDLNDYLSTTKPYEHYKSDNKNNTDVKKSSESYIIPGFRTKQPVKMIVAVLAYALIAWISFTIEIKSTVKAPYNMIDIWAERIVLFIFFILSTFIILNYRDCLNRIPIINKIKLRIVRAAICIFLIMSVLLTSLILLVNLLSTLQ